MKASLNQAYGKELLIKIQGLKVAGDNDHSRLVDNTLPVRGPMDFDEETISSAVQPSETWSTLQLIYNLVLKSAPQTVVELGTNMGFSAAYIAAALKAAGNGGRLHTLDASPYKIRYAKRMHESLGLDNVRYTTGLFEDTLKGVVAELPEVDFAFIDGNHNWKPTLEYLDLLGAKATNGAVFLFDDVVNYSEDMRAAWAAIRNHPSVYSWAEFGDVGLAIIQSF